MAKKNAKIPNTPPAVVQQLVQLSNMINAGKAGHTTHALNQLAQKYPKDYRVWNLLCAAQSDQGKHAEAAAAGEKAVALKGDSVEARKRYSRALQRLGEYEKAMVEIERALYLEPESPDLLHNKTMIFLDLGERDKALGCIHTIQRIIKDKGLAPEDYGGVFIDMARLAPSHVDPKDVIEHLDPIAENPKQSKRFREIAYHQLGRLYEAIKDYDNAFDRYSKGNEINKPEWDADVFSAYIDDLIKCWEGIASVPPSRVPGGERLIFITGMMRSGTSLTEQMIAQLPGVTPGGEMNAVARSLTPIEPRPHPLSSRPYAVSRFTYTQQVIDKMARNAWTFYNDVARTGYVTDKQPYNIWHVPLIARLFPGCKIVHTMRDPMDNCLSNYVQCYARSHPHTHTLYDLGRHHKDYQRMTEAWSKLEVVGMYNLQYEDLVADPEPQTKALCEYLGIPWDETMLRFHESDRTVRTASRDQVRQPLYKSSVKKYERYSAHLGELRRGLGLEAAGTPGP